MIFCTVILCCLRISPRVGHSLMAAACFLPSKFSDLGKGSSLTRAPMDAKDGSSSTQRMSSASCVTASTFHPKPSTQHCESVQMVTRHRRKQQVLNPPMLRYSNIFSHPSESSTHQAHLVSDILSKPGLLGAFAELSYNDRLLVSSHYCYYPNKVHF